VILIELVDKIMTLGRTGKYRIITWKGINSKYFKMEKKEGRKEAEAFS
jgi:hypothetical protein